MPESLTLQKSKSGIEIVTAGKPAVFLCLEFEPIDLFLQ